jgi:acid phosphatase family membrane protein YuiD
LIIELQTDVPTKSSDFKIAVEKDPVLKELVGHTFPEISAGIIIGFICGLLGNVVL